MTVRRVIPAAAGVIFVGVLVAAILELRTAIHQNAYVSFTTKVCQLTGEEDRERPPGKPTGAQLSGAPSGITGSDLGYPFEARNHLYFLFGDTREVEPELCPPYICGTSTAPKAALPASVKPVGSQQEWDLRTRGRDGADSIATTPLDIDPERCLPLTFLMDAPNPFEGVTPKFHAILLNGKHLGLFETPVSGFSDGGTIYAFFSVRDIRPPDCKRPEGCALGDDQPGGQSKFAMSLDGGRTFRELYVVSRAKFEWPVPVVEALLAIGARRVALIHPPWFADDVALGGKKYFEHQGFDIVYHARAALHDTGPNTKVVGYGQLFEKQVSSR